MSPTPQPPPAPPTTTAPIAAPGSARRRFQDAVVAELSELPADEALLWVRRHGLLTLARHPDLPIPLAAALQPALRRNLAANLAWIDLFRRAVDALGDLPVCPLKGICLLADVYADDPESRPLGDLDLLVPAERVDEAAQRLCEHLGLKETELSRKARRWTVERQLTGPGSLIDLHARLAVRHGAASDWSRVEPVPASLHGRSVHVLDRETTWVHLVTHWVRHGPHGPWRWVEDLLRWRELGIEPEAAARRARHVGALPTLVAGERLLARLPGRLRAEAPTPAGAWTRCRARWAEQLLWRFADGALVRTLAAVLLADGPIEAFRAAATKLGERLARGRRGADPPPETST